MTNPGKGKWKRRQYFINKRFQARFIFRFLLVLLFGAVLSVVITFVTTESTLTSSFEGEKLVIEQTSMAILPSVILTNLITTIFVGAIVIGITLLVSHKIAGPMFRFERDLQEIAGGDLSVTIRTRDGDQFESVVTGLNTMTDSLNLKVRGVREELELLIESGMRLEVSEEYLAQVRECRRRLDEKFTL